MAKEGPPFTFAWIEFRARQLFLPSLPLLLLLAVCVSSSPALAQYAGPYSIGGACPTIGQATFTNSNPAYLLICNGSNVWVLGEQFNSSGQIGVGQTGIHAALDVNGGVRVGTDVTCAASNAGEIIYTSPNIFYCNGSVWTQLLASGGGGVLTGTFAAGSAAAPSITFTEDTTTGLYQGGNIGNLYVTAGGAEAAAFYSGGNFDLNNGSNTSNGAYQIDAQTVLAFPNQDYTSIAVGQSALANVSGTSLYNTAVGTSALYGGSSGSEAYEIAVGDNTLYSDTGGTENIAIGDSALWSSTADYRNIAIGQDALYTDNGGALNVAVGAYALYSFVGNYNTAVGSQALSNSTGSPNTALGFSAGQAVGTGSYNTAVGNDAMSGSEGSLTGNNNTAVGDSALFSISGAAMDETAVGQGAMHSDQTGTDNTALGVEALYSSTNDNSNVAVGYFALYTDNGGADNTALGNDALYSNTAGSNNTAVGISALQNSSGSFETALGDNTLYSDLSGSENVAIGDSALFNNISGYENVAIGYGALYNSQNDESDIAIGAEALTNTNGANNNVAIGDQALFYNVTGGFNVALGTNALIYLTTGYQNTAIGTEALQSNVTGTDNTALGVNAGNFVTGSFNIMLGEDETASGMITSGSNNIMIGNSLTQTTPAASNQLDIGDLIMGAIGGSEVGINTTTYEGNGLTLGTGNGLYLMGASSGYTGLIANAASTPATYTLPPAPPGGAGYVLTSNSSGTMSWTNPASGLDVELSDLLAAGAANSIANGSYAQIWNWALGSTGNTAMTFGEGSASTASAELVNISTAGGSDTVPLTIANGATATNPVSINMTAGGLAVSGVNILVLPDADTTSIAVGESALKSQSATSSENSAVGSNAGQYITTGTDNVALGYEAMQGISATPLTGSYNTGVGNEALLKIQGAAQQNTALGYAALASDTTGNYNTAIGLQALTNNATGGSNTAVGLNALSNSTGGPNDALGFESGQNISTGADNVAIGYQAMQGVSATPLTGNYNVALGDSALGSAQGAAAGNVALGYEAGYSSNALTTGTNNVYVGYEAVGSAAANTNEIVLGASATGNGSNSVTLGNSSTLNTYLYDTLTIKGTSSNYVAFTAGVSPAAQTYTLPAAYPGGTGYVLTGNSSGTMTWTNPNTGLDVELSDLLAAGATNSIANGGYAQIWNWALGGTGNTAMTFGESSASTASAQLVNIATAGGSDTVPLTITNGSSATNPISINMTAGGIAVSGTNILVLPDADTTSIAVGENALVNQSATGEGNAALGNLSGEYITSGTYNTAIGSGAMEGVSATPFTGTENTAVGNDALFKAQGAAGDNTAVGGLSLYSNAIGGSNTAVGFQALYFSTANYNTGVGTAALKNGTASYNTAVGYGALLYDTSGGDNAAFGGEAMYGVSATPVTGSDNTALGDFALYSIQGAAGFNTAVGTNALYLSTTGADSTAVGAAALYSANGSPNDALGYEAGYYISTGADNVAIGYEAMQGVSATPLTGNYNTAVGYQTLKSIQGATDDDTAIGYSALASDTTGTNNTAAGQGALGSNTTGSLNTAVGDYALHSDASGNSNTAVGYNALPNSTGSSNDALGYNAGYYITSGASNVALGYAAMQGVSATPLTGSYNTGVGNSALLIAQGAAADNTTLGYASGKAITAGTDNTLVGYESGYGVTGSHNIILGEDPSSAITTGSSNILIGNSLTKVTATSSQQLDIADTIFANLGTGYVGIGTGTTAPAGILDVEGGTSTTGNGTNVKLYAQTALAGGAYNGGSIILMPGTNNSGTGASGYVGIGTASPGATLDVAGQMQFTTGAAINLSLNNANKGNHNTLTMNTGSNGDAQLLLQRGGTTKWGIGLPYSSDGDVSAADNYFYFGTGEGSGNIMVLTPAGSVGIANTNPGALLDIGTAGTTLGTLRLESSASGYVGFQAPASATSVTYTLPTAAPGGAGYVLTSNSSGTMSWTNPNTGLDVELSDLLAAGSANSIANGSYAQVWNWALGATGNTAMTFGEGSASTASAELVNIATAGGSDTVPLTITNGATAANPISINMSLGALAIGGTQVLYLPDADTTSIAVGESALASQSATSEKNAALGYAAGQYITTGTDSVAIGYAAMQGVSATPLTGVQNTAVGYIALNAIQGGADYNTALGSEAMQVSTTGVEDTAVGTQALRLNTTGSLNTALGFEAMYANTTGSNNTAVGYSALYANTVANNNTAVGDNALVSSTAASNTAVGYEALYADTTGGANVAVGSGAMLGASATPITGSYNVALGDLALGSAQGAAAGNVALGYEAGYSSNALTTGTNNVYIGYEAVGSAATNTNEIVIGEATTGNGSNTITLGNSSILNTYLYDTLTIKGTSSNYVALTAGASPAAQTYTLPSAYPGGTGYVLTSNSSGMMSWTNPSTGLDVDLSDLLAAGAANTIANTTYAQVWNWALGSTGNTAMTFGESSASTAAAELVNITTAGGSDTTPLTITNGSSATNPVSINMSLGALAIGGTQVLYLPDADTTSIAVGESALASQSATSKDNVGVGYNAGEYISTGANNVAVGYKAMAGVSATPLTGSDNTAVGYAALSTAQGGAGFDTAVGYNALPVSTGTGNTAVGASALQANTTGNYNVAIGESALQLDTTGKQNTVVGDSALLYNTTGSNSTAVGYTALYKTTGSPNDALGYQAGYYITSGASNVAIGYESMQGVSATPVTGSDNTSVGNSALLNAQGAAASNTAVGYYSLASNTTGSDSTAVGVQALTSANGSPNDALGYEAGYYISTGASNVALGYEAMQGVSATPLTGNYNVAIGDLALGSAQGAAAGNVALGYQAGYSGTALTTGTDNIYIGYNAAANAATDTNEIVLGEATTGQGSNTITLGNSSNTNTYDYGTLTLKGTTSGYVALSPGANPTAQTYTLPAAYPGGAGYVLSSNSAGTMTWTNPASGLDVDLSDLLAASAANSIANGTYAQIWNWALGSTGYTAFTFGESSASTASAELVAITTAGGSDTVPLTIANGSSATNPVSINMTAGGIAISGTNILILPDADTTSIAVGENALANQSGTNKGNAGLGDWAGKYISTGGGNTALGYGAMEGVSATPITGGNNTAVGFKALYVVQDAAANNTAVGYGALQSDTTGSSSTAVGEGALNSATGSPNDALGYLAGYYITSGASNVALGYAAMKGISATPLTGSGNAALGNAALQNIQGAAAYNTAIGFDALVANTTGNHSTAVGGYALNSATGSPNDGLGYAAGYYITSGTGNVAVGDSAMKGISATPLTGSYNVAIGDLALASAQGTAAGNTALGYEAGYSSNALTTGTNNVYIGYEAVGSAAANTNEIVIGEATTGNGSNTITLGNSSNTAAYMYGALDLKGSSSGYTGFVAPATVTTSGAYTLPAAPPGASNYVLSSTSAGALAWIANGGGGSSALSALQNAAASNTLANSTYAQAWNWSLGSSGHTAMTFGEGAASTANAELVAITTAGGSDTTPLTITNGSSATNPVSINMTAGGIAIGGANILVLPDQDVESIAVGWGALASYTGGYAGGNVAVGYDALYSNTTGLYNAAIGTDALNANTTGSENTAVGNGALNNNTTGQNNIAIGFETMVSNTTGSYNTAIGGLGANTSGGGNVAVGDQALNANTSGGGNIAVGGSALTANATGGGNVAVGAYALAANTTGSDSTAIGPFALYSATGSPNDAFGTNAGNNITTGADNVAIGDGAMNGVSSTPLTGSYNTGIGNSALNSIQGAGANNTAVGYGALYSDTTTAGSTAVGYQALYDNTTAGNTAVGYDALKVNTSGADVNAFGYNALQANTTGNYNSAFSNGALNANTSGSQNTALGLAALYSNTTGSDSTAVGYYGLYNATGSPNDALGYQAGEYITSGAGNVAIGYEAMTGTSAAPLTGSGNTAVGYQALTNAHGSANWNVAIGYTAMPANTTGSENIGIGYEALNNNTIGGYNISIGQAAMAANQSGSDSTAIGASALFNATTGPNDAIGYTAGDNISTGTNNVAIGYAAMQGVAATPITGSYNTGVGNSALNSIQGAAAGNVALGTNAGYSGTALTTGADNVYIGYNAAANAAADTNEIVIGEGATGQGSNTTTIGNSSTTYFYPAGTLIGKNTSFLTTTASTTSTSLTSSGLTLPAIPANTNVSGRCVLIWQNASTSGHVEFGINTSSAPTQLWIVNNTYNAALTNLLTSITTATTTPVTVSMTPNASATNYSTILDLNLESGSSAETLTVYFETSSSSHATSLEAGSSCSWLP
ncbi:MAG: hypothetical protein ACLQVY_21785 [Limisphaerales bacterium]